MRGGGDWDPTVGPCLGPYGGPRGGGASSEQGNVVRGVGFAGDQVIKIKVWGAGQPSAVDLAPLLSVRGLGCRIRVSGWGLGFGACDLGLGVCSLGSGVSGCEFRV